jgi:DNA-binding LacI/PurR family transcriptional regulator
LTTVRQDAARLGAEAVRAVTSRLDDATGPEGGPTPDGAVVEPELVVRRSTAAPPQGQAS